MDANQLKRLEEIYHQFLAHDAEQSDRTTRYRNIEPESAKFLSMLITIQQSQQLLEIGTSTGYSTLWLADAVKSTKGHLTTLEIDPERSQQAKANIQEFGLQAQVEFWIGDAQTFLDDATQQYDLILLDAERDAYIEYWASLKSLLKHPHGVLIVDNVISHAEQVADFIEIIQQDEHYMSQVLAIGAGLLLVSYVHH